MPRHLPPFESRNTPAPTGAKEQASILPSAGARKAVVLLSVLVVVALLSLSVYHYSDLAFAEYKAADQSQRKAQALALANSGIHYVMGLLSNPEDMNNTTAGNIYNNPSIFSKVAVQGDAKSGYSGTFSLLAPPDPTDSSGSIRFGVIDESGKFNLNSLIQIDPSGKTIVNLLQNLPNMNTNIAGAIADWLDADDTPQTNGGAESSTYSSLTPSYAARNGTLDTFDELLLVQGVTPDLLYGQFRNPFFGLPTPGLTGSGGVSSTPNSSSNTNNNSNNSGTNNSNSGSNNSGNNSGNNGGSSSGTIMSVTNSGTVDLGWSAFLTIYSREQNIDGYGNQLIYLNDKDLGNLSQNLTSAGFPASIVNFIILYRQNGSSTSSSSSSFSNSSSSGGSGSNSSSRSSSGDNDADDSSSGGGNSSGNGSSSQGNAADPAQATINTAIAGNTQLKSVFDLVNAQVQATSSSSNSSGNSSGNGSSSGNTGSSSGNKPVTYNSPFQDSGTLQQWLPLLWSMTTVNKGTDTPARVNINTAPAEVLSALANLSGGFSQSDVQTILSTRPPLSSNTQPDPIYNTPVWLITNAGLSASKLSAMSQYITTTSQVYRVQVLGTLDGPNGMSARVEAIIDTNGGQPRILAWRNLSQLGKGVSAAQLAQAGTGTGTATGGGAGASQPAQPAAASAPMGGR